ncbi:hypothetical protein CEUSTIGMA_g2722.t1 [Chlamydomonas eustigma]|uniref:Peroxisome biogenesis protein 22 n=1 Tax=Chlamydomonas eustigma TaxID=1157962 RepID=A0A250WWR4_9CHLO|nr:hypothetical protein CEUSTIGMA_g2722.t1 [Chlamydomonas eustigma]|eukprot:GAX75277.1 hypothetical protein CEUSTIGMA_g2722.t1 [Chlamydomonas eustigma]
MDLIRDIINQLYERVLSFIQTSSPATLQLSGILGLALALIGYFQLRGGNAVPPARPPTLSRPERSQQTQSQPSSSKPESSISTVQNIRVTRDSPIARTVQSRLQGVRRVTISCPNVILQPGQILETAALHPEAAEIVKEMCYMRLEVYLISMVSDDIGEALISGALESEGVSSASTQFAEGMVPSHRVLFCSTLEGKVAIVRQLEPDLHVDSLDSTVEGLQRFIPALWQVVQSGNDTSVGSNAYKEGGATAANVQRGPSLSAFFGLQ